MPHLPSVEHYMQQSEAHLHANSWEEDRYKDILSCMCEAAAFSVLVYLLTNCAELTYDGINKVLRKRFCGNGY